MAAPSQLVGSSLSGSGWRPAIKAAEINPGLRNGMHVLRHTYASVLLDAGETIKALSLYFGHTDPGFTPRIYTHLLFASEDRTRRAIVDRHDACLVGRGNARSCRKQHGWFRQGRTTRRLVGAALMHGRGSPQCEARGRSLKIRMPKYLFIHACLCG